MADDDVRASLIDAATAFEKDVRPPSSVAVEPFPPNAQETLTKMAIATMIYQHGMNLFNAGYDKAINRFVMTSDDALLAATMFLAKSFDQEAIVRRFATVGEKYSVRNVYLEIEMTAESGGAGADFL